MSRPTFTLLAVLSLLVGCNDETLEIHDYVYLPPVSASNAEWSLHPPQEDMPGRLAVDPPEVDFGPVPPSCSRTITLTLTNVGGQPVTVAGVAAGIGSSTDFTSGTIAITLTPRETTTLDVTYMPRDVGEDVGSLTIQTDGSGGGLVVVPLAGRDSPGAEGVDSFEQREVPPADVLWIIDNSGSMEPLITQVVENFSGFIDELTETSVDYQMGFVTTSIPTGMGKLQGEYGPSGSPYITSNMGEEGLDAFLNQIMISLNVPASGTEQGLDAMAIALSDENLETIHQGFIREGKRLVILAISDENDFSEVSDLSFYQDRLLKLKGTPTLISFSSIVGMLVGGVCARPGVRYLDMSSFFGGYTDDICKDNWSAMMEALGAAGAGEWTTFELEEIAEPLYPIQVTIDGAPTEEGVDWSYDEITNAVILDRPAEVGAEIRVEYTVRGDCE